MQQHVVIQPRAPACRGLSAASPCIVLAAKAHKQPCGHSQLQPLQAACLPGYCCSATQPLATAAAAAGPVCHGQLSSRHLGVTSSSCCCSCSRISPILIFCGTISAQQQQHMCADERGARLLPDLVSHMPPISNASIVGLLADSDTQEGAMQTGETHTLGTRGKDSCESSSRQSALRTSQEVHSSPLLHHSSCRGADSKGGGANCQCPPNKVLTEQNPTFPQRCQIQSGACKPVRVVAAAHAPQPGCRFMDAAARPAQSCSCACA